MKGVCAKIFMVGTFGQNGIDSVLSGFACFLVDFFLLFLFWWVFWSSFIVVFFPLPKQTFGTLRHTGKKFGCLVNSFQATYTYFPSLFLFLSSYPEIHFSMIWVVSSAWAPEFCGGKGHKSRAWHCLNGTAVRCGVVWDWFCVNHLSSTEYCTKWSTLVTISVHCLLKCNSVPSPALRSF